MRRHWSNSRGVRLPPGQAPGGAPAPTPVSPDTISGLALWIDPSDAGTVSYSGGASISQIDDKASGVQGRSAGDQYFLAPSAAVEPTMETIAGRNALRFAGTTAADYMRLYTAANGGWTQKMLQSNTYPGSQWDGIVGTSEAVTIVAIIEPVTMNTVPSATTYDHPGIVDFSRGYGPGIYQGKTTAGSGFLRMYMYSYQTPFATYAMRPVPANGFPVSVGTNTAYACTWRHDDPGALYATGPLEGGTDLTVAPQSGGEVQTRSYQSSGHNYYWRTKEAFLGLGYSVGNGYCDVRIGEVCMWNRALTDVELASMASYFAGRWGT